MPMINKLIIIITVIVMIITLIIIVIIMIIVYSIILFFGLVLCRNQSIDLQHDSVIWFL